MFPAAVEGVYRAVRGWGGGTGLHKHNTHVVETGLAPHSNKNSNNTTHGRAGTTVQRHASIDMSCCVISSKPIARTQVVAHSGIIRGAVLRLHGLDGLFLLQGEVLCLRRGWWVGQRTSSVFECVIDTWCAFSGAFGGAFAFLGRVLVTVCFQGLVIVRFQGFGL